MVLGKLFFKLTSSKNHESVNKRKIVMNKIVLILMGCTIVSCGGGGGDSESTNPSPVTPTSPSWKQGFLVAGGSHKSGVYLDVVNINNQQYSGICDASLGCVGSVIAIKGSVGNASFVRYANYQANSANIGEVPLSSITFDTKYAYTSMELALINSTGESTTYWTPNREREVTISLTFNPNSGKITGGDYSHIKLDGVAKGNVISGAVDIPSIFSSGSEDGTFEGVIGTNGVIGSFVGGEYPSIVGMTNPPPTVIYSGGFIGNPM